MSGGEEKPLKSSDLKRSAVEFFRRKGFKVEENVSLEGYRGLLRKFDLLIQKGKLTQGVWIKEWNRTIGINILINLDKASEEVGLANPIIVGEEFSDHAKFYANRRKITLLTKRQILQSLS